MDEPKPSKEELLKIAAEVWEGSRPASDLDKYGITLGETLTGDAAREKLLAELEGTSGE